MRQHGTTHLSVIDANGAVCSFTTSNGEGNAELVETPDGSITALGSGGSNQIRSAICQVILRLRIDECSIETAVNPPRLHMEADHLDFEDLHGAGIRRRIANEFPDHRAWPKANMFYGGVHTAHVDPVGNFSGVGHPRRVGAKIIID